MLSNVKLPVCPIDGEGADRAFLVVTHPIGLIGGIQSGSGGIQDQAARACSHLVNAGGRHRPGGAIHLEQVYAATIAGRQIHLRWQHITERRTEGADIRDEWPAGFLRSRWSGPAMSGVVPASATDLLRNERRERSNGVMVIKKSVRPMGAPGKCSSEQRGRFGSRW